MKKTDLWVAKERDWEGIKRLVEALGISPLSAHLLINRGIMDIDSARDFFEVPLERLSVLDEITGSVEAAKLIAESLRNGERVMIYGDYDADGVTATTVMVKGLKAVGADVDYYVPDRFSEGYDLNESFVRLAAEDGYSLIITVDCGIKAFECITQARELGLKVIVTDHHEPSVTLPEADVLIDPKLDENPYTRELAGVGVALSVVRNVFKETGFLPGESFLRELLELAAIGTIADSVALTGCNRIIVKQGLRNIGATSNIGLTALMEVEGLKGREELEVADVSFKLAPCINAVGRLGDATEAVALLLSESPQEAWDLARKLHRDNSVRQNLDGAAFLEIVERIEREFDLEKERVIVLASEEWHPGVVGITAARVAQRFNIPAVLIAVEDGVGKGSGRSTGDFDMNEAFNRCADILLKYGGHKLAGGFSIEENKIEDFRVRIRDFARIWEEEEQVSVEEADAEILFEDIHAGLIEEMEAFKPFGVGNPQPMLMCRNVRVDRFRIVGKKNEHIKLLVSSGDRQMDCIGFRMSDYISSSLKGRDADIIFSPQLNTWNGSTQIELLLHDIFPSHGGHLYPAPMPAGESLVKESGLLEQIQKGVWYQYLGAGGDRFLVSILQDLINASVLPVVLFPLQSLASDFERALKGFHKGLKVSRIDCVDTNEAIQQAARSAEEGSSDLLLTSVRTWISNKSLYKGAAARKSCLCIHLGHWGAFPVPAYLLDEAVEAMEGWQEAAVILGSGEGLDSDALRRKLGISEVQKEKASVETDFIFNGRGDKFENVLRYCSGFGKTVIFVNSGRKAMRLAGEAAQRGKRIRCFYGGLPSSQKKLVLDEFNFGTSSCLIASRNLEPYMIKNAESVVFYSFPLNVYDFNRFLIAPRVFLEYNNSDFQESKRYVRSLCPSVGTIQYIAGKAAAIGCGNNGELLKTLDMDLKENKAFGKRELSVALAIYMDISSLPSPCFETEVFYRSWRYLEARREVEVFDLLVDKLAAGSNEAAAAAENTQ